MRDGDDDNLICRVADMIDDSVRKSLQTVLPKRVINRLPRVGAFDDFIDATSERIQQAIAQAGTVRFVVIVDLLQVR